MTADLNEAIESLISERDRSLAHQLVASMTGLFEGQPATVDLKIISSTVAEMAEAFQMFAPFRDIPKVTIFGSARTKPHDPLYEQAKAVAEHLAAAGWMVVTGAGPGIMQAAMEGAGRDHSIGVSIRLPFEQAANPIIAGDSKNVIMKYCVTRKRMLVKESRGFVCLPGGFGTLDETFELLTLTQTGKGSPVPIVLLDAPGDPYWETVHQFVDTQLVRRGLVSPADTGLYMVTEDTQQAIDEIVGYYANYDSLRYVGDLLVLRVRQPVSDALLARLNQRFGHLCKHGMIERVPAQEAEVRDHDRADLPRIGFVFARHGYGELRAMIDTINQSAD